MSMTEQWLLGLAAASLVLWAVWWRQLRTRDATAVDAAWSALVGALGVAFAIAGSGSPAARWLAGLVAAAWSGRLTFHLLRDRVFAHRGEDGRYAAMRARFGARAGLHFAWFHQLQALLAAVFALPFLWLAQDPRAALAPEQWLGLLVIVLGVAGEGLADRQLRRHRRDPAQRGRTCRSGLWHWSRHPNYFCEWLTWCGIALLATGGPHGLAAWFAPALMYLLVRFVSGVPFAEQQSLRSRGDDYRRYIATTNAFFPWWPRGGRADER